MISFIFFLAISVLEKKTNNETLAATYEGKVMTIMMFGIV